MTHILVMILFAVLVGTVFGVVSHARPLDQLKYGLKVVIEFLAVAFVLSWLIYFLPL